MGFLNKFKTKWAKKNANGEYHFLFTEEIVHDTNIR